MPRFRYRKRAFLAPASADATSFVWAEVESSDNGDYKLGNYVLIVADCSRRIQLEFPLSTSRVRRESLAKVDLLFEVLSAFRDALHAEASLIEKNR